MSEPRTQFTTPKGTVLPLLNLKGKEYLQVAHRIVWMREEHPNWTIHTEVVSMSLSKESGEFYAIFRATILDGERVISQGTKFESLKGFPDFIEKAETGAVGRALALAGYGTQFAPEFDEGDRLADAPVATVQHVASVASKENPLKPIVLLKRTIANDAKEVFKKE